MKITDAKVYQVKRQPVGTRPEEIDWPTVPAAGIDTYRWPGGGYAPRAEARLVWIPEDGFVLRMSCAETEPKAVYTQYNQPVYTDSCLEFFAAWVDGDPRYMNMEMNARGTLLSCLGADRAQRTPIADLTGGLLPAVTGCVNTDGWSVIAHIPAELLSRVYGLSRYPLASGLTFRGNFYKCGDETPIPHYGMWNPVMTPKPDFHWPEFFGIMTLE